MGYTNNLDLCPGCDGGQKVDFFQVRRPVDVGRPYFTKEDAQKAVLGSIDLCFCTTCELVSNRSFQPELLDYQPGYEVSLVHSPIFQSFTKNVASRLIERYDLRNKTVVEIGCGKGEFLSLICGLGKNIGYGFDPSLNVDGISSARVGQVQLIRDYFDERYAHLVPDLVCCLSVFEHIQKPIEFLAAIRKIIGASKTIIYFEVFNGFRALQELSSWSVHYEQCNYWSQNSLRAAFEKCGFRVLDTGTCYGDGEYLYIEAEAADSIDDTQNRAVFDVPEELALFSGHHNETVIKWTATLKDLHDSGKSVAVWGTGGKGIGFLNAVQSEHVSCVVDINPNRQRKFVPGSAHRIEAPQYLKQIKPDVIIVTNPLYRCEIEAQATALGITSEFLIA